MMVVGVASDWFLVRKQEFRESAGPFDKPMRPGGTVWHPLTALDEKNELYENAVKTISYGLLWLTVAACWFLKGFSGLMMVVVVVFDGFLRRKLSFRAPAGSFNVHGRPVRLLIMYFDAFERKYSFLAPQARQMGPVNLEILVFLSNIHQSPSRLPSFTQKTLLGTSR
jgi:hypothetical protein